MESVRFLSRNSHYSTDAQFFIQEKTRFIPFRENSRDVTHVFFFSMQRDWNITRHVWWKIYIDDSCLAMEEKFFEKKMEENSTSFSRASLITSSL